ncbi:MAG: tryptophan synthase subunit alpha [Erysipelotrichaceae bacterium]|jgi:tryptophan synthase alpha subunit
MTNRINRVIEQAQKENRLAFIGLAPIMPQSMEKSLEVVDMLVESGVDIMMVHIVNWMPWMEGRTLQTAARIPRHAGITREDIFKFIKKIREKYPAMPIIDMTLYETALTMGQDRFLKLSEDAEVDGYDLPNYPLLQTDDKYGLYKWCIDNDRHLILNISYEEAMSVPGTIDYKLLEETCRLSRGFVFVMNAPGGQSGSDKKLTNQQLKEAVANVKNMMKAKGNNDCTVSIVCGIRNEEDLNKLKESKAESFMIGSAYIDMILEGKPLEEVAKYVKSIREMCNY